MRKILVLQMCRLGDILQTTPMLRGIREERPDAEVTLVLHELFADAPVPAGLADRVVAFPYAEMGEALADDPDSWPRQLARLRSFLQDLAGPFDLVLNLTHTDLSSLLAAAIPSRRVEGGLVAPNRNRIVRGPWMSYFWASQINRAQGCFNLVDLYQRAAGLAPAVRPLEIAVHPAEAARADAWLRERGLAGSRLVAMQLGASDERKQWPPEKFARMADRLPPELGEVVLVGAEAERPLAARAARHASRRLHDATGATTVGGLAALLARSSVLVTNDTGPMHVASAVGTRVVDLSTGPVFVHETGPYGEGHFVVEPDVACFPCVAGSDCRHMECRDHIEPDDVAALTAHALGHGAMPRPARARILRGGFLGAGRIEFTPVWPDARHAGETLRAAAAVMWEETLADAWSPAPAARDRRPRQGAVGASGVDLAALRALAVQAREAAALADRLSSNGAGARLPGIVDARVDELVRQAQADPAGGPIAAYLRVRIESAVEKDLGRLARIYATELRAAAARAQRLEILLAGEALDSGGLRARRAGRIQVRSETADFLTAATETARVSPREST